MRNDLKFTIPLKELKGRGYTFQKLFAADYKSYRIKIDDHTIWLWEKGRLLEINDWHQHTGNIIEFYKNNLDKHTELNSKLPKPSQRMVLRINEETSEVSFKDMEEYFNLIRNNYVDEEVYEKKYEGFREVVIYIPSFHLILNEISVLTK